ncbi:mechanosensitive ion channel family protein [Chitinilyticum piscinae]|uniref:Mechanosensitive ion channel n=1 Tax=Chitinilyticum piscinae TaxID=2866724 RepID=A0A8J7K8V5_9NEIS|nr:mechanosensitive ion channel domain-containing protein [Chitinilyticum piscinae]MBE9610243.1 mechanosensitive ion channel [Chitinilyticum piscinae]
MSKKHALSSLIALLLCWPALLPATALLPVQDEGKTAPEPIIQAVAIEDIPAQIAADTTFAEGVLSRSALAADPAGLERELQEIEGRSRIVMANAAPAHARVLSYVHLLSLDQHLTLLQRQLASWQERAEKGGQSLSVDAAKLAQRRLRWLKTSEALDGGLAPPLLSSIAELSAVFEQAEGAIAPPLSALIALSKRAAALKQELDGSRQQLGGLLASSGQGVWSKDAPGLWQIFNEKTEGAATSSLRLLETLKVEADFYSLFEEHTQRQQFAATLFGLILLPVLLWISRAARREGLAGSDFANYRKTLSRPIAALILLYLVMQLLITVHGPYLRQQLLLLAAWLPVMRLQSGRMQQLAGHWVYATLVFILLELAGSLFSASPPVYRSLLLVQGLSVMLVLSLVWRRVASLKDEFAWPRLRKVVQLLLGIGIVLMAAALLGNVTGRVYLADLLSDGVISAIYTGLFLLAARNVLQAYTHFGLRRLFQRGQQGRANAARLLQLAGQLLNVLVVLAWFSGVLQLFHLWLPLRSLLAEGAALSLGVGAVTVTIGGIVLFCVSVFLSFWVARMLRLILNDDILPMLTLPRGVANSVATMSYYAVLLLGLVLALSAAGFQLGQLAMVIGALSVGIGFGLQTVVNNFVSGLILMLERPIQPGDTVEVSGTAGTVREIGMRTTTVTTFDGADVVIPNGMLLAEKLTNWTLNNRRRRIEIPVGVAYGSDPRAVQAMLLELVNKTAGVSHVLPPVVLFSGFGASSLDFTVRAWTDNYDLSNEIRSSLALAIHDRLREAGVEIPFPQQDIHLRSVTEAAQAMLGGSSPPAPAR